MTRQLKPATTIAQQVQLLRKRGMEVDTDLARQWLTNVSYYRLSAYCHGKAISCANLGVVHESLAQFTDFRG